jgi:hypothetical protein
MRSLMAIKDIMVIISIMAIIAIMAIIVIMIVMGTYEAEYFQSRVGTIFVITSSSRNSNKEYTIFFMPFK